MAARFHELKVASIARETPEAVAVGFEVPDDLREAFAFRPGQYLTLATDIDGQEARRSYSICSAPGEPTLRVGVKKVLDGRFSSFVNEKLSVGDVIRGASPRLGARATTISCSPPAPASRRCCRSPRPCSPTNPTARSR